MIKFSICIPAFKSLYLQRCIASVLEQTVSEFELIILNDCSPEPVEAIVQQFEDDRIHYYCNDTNVGAIKLVENWNKCLDLAQGEYIMIMGDDDELEPNYLTAFSELIQRYPQLDVYHCRSKIIDDQGKIQMLTPACPDFEYVYDSIWHRLEQYRSNYISDFVYRTAALRSQGGFYNLPLAWGSDDITAFRATGTKGIAHTNKSVFRYRSNALSITSTGNSGIKMEANLAYATWLHHFLLHTPADNEQLIVQKYLCQHQKRLMRARKRYTMVLSMQRMRLKKFWFWLKNRNKYQLQLTDIVIAAVKSAKTSRHPI